MLFVIRVIIFIFISLFFFLGGYLIANYHLIANEDCQTSKIPATTNRIIATRPPTRAIPVYEGGKNYSSISRRFTMKLNPSYSKLTDGIAQPRALSEVFKMFHHPGSPLTSEVVLYARGRKNREKDLYDDCNRVFLTRTGSLANMPNKCLAVGFVPEADVDPIPHSHRRGKISGMINMYQQDYIKQIAQKTEKMLLPMLLENLEQATADFIKVTGNPIREDGSRRSIMVMVLNEGVLDVFLNFVCSCRAAGISDIFENLVVILGQDYLVPVIESMGIKAFYSKYLGPIPQKAADFYGDFTFGILMWFKVNSVYLAFNAGFHVLFQDVDLVWMENALPILEKMTEYDIVFMDDGARTPRFTPFYFNSGFYYVRQTDKSKYLMERMLKIICELAETHSHQATLTKYFSEVIDFTPIKFRMLESHEYPAGYQFHHEKEYIKDLLDYKVLPKVFHMCWTESRKDKVKYLREMGLWFLPEEIYGTDPKQNPNICYTTQGLRQISASSSLRRPVTTQTSAVLQQCCLTGNYWTKRKEVLGEGH